MLVLNYEFVYSIALSHFKMKEWRLFILYQIHKAIGVGQVALFSIPIETIEQVHQNHLKKKVSF